MGNAMRCVIFWNAFKQKQYDSEKLYEALNAFGITVTEDVNEADFAISMGGDGTFLTTAMRVGQKQIPILGINTGRLGFLADFSLDDIMVTLDQFLSGQLRTEYCNILQVESSDGKMQGYPFALNEVAVLKRDNSSMISIRVDLDGEYLTTYQADGLIVNTPTGSTGYALSVGGPVMLPGSQNIGLVPVAPHGLTVRPLMLPDNIKITLTVESRSHNFLVAIDGRSESCQDSTTLTIRKAPYQVLALKRPETSFLHTLRNKLLWGSDTRNR